MVVPPRKPGTYSSFKPQPQDGNGNEPSKMAEDLANSQVDKIWSPVVNGTRAFKQKRVCVVGSGVAGLRCAEVLIANGMDVTVVEARDRVGGRLTQTKLNGHTVDLGPNWIHGTENNPIYELVRSTGTATYEVSHRSTVFDNDAPLPGHISTLISEIVWPQIEAAMKFSNENSDTENIAVTSSLLTWMQEVLPVAVEAKMLEDKSRVKELAEPDTEAWKALHRQLISLCTRLSGFWGCFVGSEVSKQSLKFFWLEECLDGENLFCAQTYEKVLESISKPILDAVKEAKAKILFKNEIYRIDTRDGLVKVLVRDLNDGQTVELDFDDVVMTVPLGWWKKNQDKIYPPLPPRFSEAIESLGYGNLEKTYVTFPTAFWEDEPLETDFESEAENSASETTSATGDVDDVNAPTSRKAPSMWTFLHQSDSRPETSEILSLSCLPAPYNHPTLLFYTSGPNSELLSSLGTQSPIHVSTQASKHPIFTTFIEPLIKSLPNYDASSPNCCPVEFLFTNWAHDQWAGNGSYTFFPVGGTDLSGDVECLREGIPERNIWVAGEHTAPFVALGTVTGAWWSGDRVGRAVLKGP